MTLPPRRWGEFGRKSREGARGSVCFGSSPACGAFHCLGRRVEDEAPSAGRVGAPAPTTSSGLSSAAYSSCSTNKCRQSSTSASAAVKTDRRNRRCSSGVLG